MNKPFKLKPSNGKTWKRIRSVSNSPHAKAKRNKLKVAQAEVRERSGGRCERIIFIINSRERDIYRCSGDAIDYHHMLARSQGGDHSKENLLHLCRQCHSFCKDFPIKATCEGLVIPYKGYKHE